MDVLVIGGGGREHALAWKIRQSPRIENVFCAPGNAGTDSVAVNISIKADDIDGLLQFALERNIGLTVVGPEQPLVMGVVDRFRGKGLRIFGPTARAAAIEGSKAFSKNLMRQYGIPTGDFQTFQDADDAQAYIRGKGPLVVKADGLAAGKGVLLCRTEAEAVSAVDSVMKEKAFGDAGNTLVIEEFLEGPEISLLAFSDGKSLLALDSAQDHKAAYDGDRGPNTGGMGAYSPAPTLTPVLLEKVMAEVMYPVIEAMGQENRLYQGLLYAGLMLTVSGPKVLEFNARFGDPETQPLMMRLKTDLVTVMEACIDGTLNEHHLEWDDRASVCVVMAAEGYPSAYEKGRVIRGLDVAGSLKDVMVFHAGSKLEDGSVVTNGGRVLGVTALGDKIPVAIKNAYAAVEHIQWKGLHYRKDIGRRDGSS